MQGWDGVSRPASLQPSYAGQTWVAFITNPNSLCARVLKGRYFPDTDFMHAPKSASATWKAIVAGRNGLKTGLISRVGDGSTISVWEDKWIPGTVSMTPTQRPTDTKIDRVSDLIDTRSWSWKHEVIMK